MKPMSDIFDKHADNYSEDIDDVLGNYGASHDFFTAHKAWLIEHLLEAEGRAPGDVALLDVGCGVGKIHGLLKGQYRSLTGVDVSTASIEVARETHPEVSYETYDGLTLPFPDGSFDLSMAICVFHHVPPEQWVDLAREMVRVVRPGGICLVIEHNPFNPVTWRIVNTCPLDKDAILLRASRTKEIFRSAGSEDVFSRAVMSVPPVNGFLKRVDHLLGVLPFGAQYYTLARKAQTTGG